MKENWTYKKLDEVCNINYGTRVVQKKDKGSTYYVYGGGGATFMVDTYNREDCFIVSRFAMSQKCTRFVKGKFFLNDSGLSVSPKIKGLTQPFLDKVLLANNDTIYSYGKGMAQRNLDIPSFKKLIIPIPPLATQSRIVSELDLLQSLIDKQKAQLKELDNLAQAIFYDMFGDPMENEKGWEVKDLGDLCEVYRGGSPRPIERFLGGTIPWIKIGDATKGDDIYLHQTKEHIIEEGLKKTRYIHAGSLIFANCGVSLGFARIITFDGCIHDGWLAFDNVSKSIEKVFLLKSLNFCTSYFRSIAPDGTQPNLNTAIMKSFKQILPPLPKQKLYIAKIESIEKQKAAISKSIEETQKLFDYTMDKYFG